MKLLYVLDPRFSQLPDGSVWNASLLPEVWDRYLTVIDTITVVARMEYPPSVQQGWHRVDTEKVSFRPIPNYAGLRDYLRHFRRVRSAARNAVGIDVAVNFRIGSQLAGVIEERPNTW